MRAGEGGRRYCRKRRSRRRDAPQALLIDNAMQHAAAVRCDALLPLRLDCVRLTPEQQDVVTEVVVKRQSVFLTGNAGTGKSFLVSYLVDARDGADAVAATAPTAAAARLLPGGVTLASFGG